MPTIALFCFYVKGLKKLISWAFAEYGTARTAQMADELKGLGFRYATKAGVSISVEDLEIPSEKKELLAQAEAEIENVLSNWNESFWKG